MHPPQPGPALDVLLPAGPSPVRIDTDPGEPRLRELYAHPVPADAGAWVRATMIATLDGASTGADGRSGSINGPADHRVFAVLRSLADVVLVGAGTVRAEGYRELPVRTDLVAARAARGQRAHLELAVVSRSGPLPADLQDGDRPPLVITTGDRPDLGELRRRLGADRVLTAGVGRVDLRAGLDQLAFRGLPRVLAEGGPRLLADLVAARLVHDLCLTTAPTLVGGPARRVLDGEGWLTPPAAARCLHLLHSDGVLLGRWLLPDAPVDVLH